MIEITPKAVEELGKLLASRADSPQAGLRLAVRRGGCAGWQYEMNVAEPELGDEIVVSGTASTACAAVKSTIRMILPMPALRLIIPKLRARAAAALHSSRLMTTRACLRSQVVRLVKLTS